MAYFKARVGGDTIKRKPLVTGFFEGNGADSFTFSAKVGDLIVYSGWNLPTITGAETISTWRSSSDVQNKNAGLYRVTSSSCSFSVSGQNYTLTIFSSSTKAQLEYDFETLSGSNVHKTISIKEDEILTYPQVNTILNISGSDARYMFPSKSYAPTTIRCLADSILEIWTISGVGLTVVKIY